MILSDLAPVATRWDVLKTAENLPWAQGVAGSNPVAPTKSLRNLHNTHEERESDRGQNHGNRKGFSVQCHGERSALLTGPGPWSSICTECSTSGRMRGYTCSQVSSRRRATSTRPSTAPSCKAWDRAVSSREPGVRETGTHVLKTGAFRINEQRGLLNTSSSASTSMFR